jgi:hypothetical protein
MLATVAAENMIFGVSRIHRHAQSTKLLAEPYRLRSATTGSRTPVRAPRRTGWPNDGLESSAVNCWTYLRRRDLLGGLIHKYTQVA